jgi:Tfp pilus assembly protein PilP
MMRMTVAIFAVTLLAATPVSGQAPAAGQVAPRPATVTTPANPVPSLEPNGYDYDPSGRRDPFISLVRRTTAAVGTSATTRPRGVAGLSVDEIVVRGLMQGRHGWAAVVKGVDNRSYTIRAGDELFDGTVKAVSATGLIVLQNVNDPMSTAKTREVKKLLRPEAQ